MMWRLLGTPRGTRTWARLKRIEDFLALHPDDPDLAEMREKLRLMKGVMYWRLSESFKARLWNERRSVKELEASLARNAEARRAGAARRAPACRPTPADSRRASRTMRARMDQLQERLCDARGKAEPLSAGPRGGGAGAARSSASRPTRCRRASNWPRSTIVPPMARRTRHRKRRRTTPGEAREHPAGEAMRFSVSQLTCGAAVIAAMLLGPSTLSAANKQAGDHQGSRGPAGRRQPRSAEECRQQQDHGQLQALPRFECGRCGVARRSAAPPGRLESRELANPNASSANWRPTKACGRPRPSICTRRCSRPIPKYERNDSVLYQLARAYELNAQPDKALASLDRLVANYPEQPITSTRRSSAAASCCSRTRPIRRRRRAYEAVIKIGADLGVLQPKPLQARLVAVQARRDRAQPRLIRRRPRFGARLQGRSRRP